MPDETPQTITLPVPKTAEELKIFMILEDPQLKAAYKEFILQATINLTRAEVESRTISENKEGKKFKPETL